MSYSQAVWAMMHEPTTHLWAIWGLWALGYMRYINRRVKRIENHLGIVPPPYKPEIKPED